MELLTSCISNDELSTALKRLESRDLSIDELQRLGGIEKWRDSLRKSKHSVRHVDFGAGGPNQSLPTNITQAGVVMHSDTATVVELWSKSEPSCRFLYKVIREIKPKLCLELGTGAGISAAYLATALSDNGDISRLITLDGSPNLVRLAQSLLTELNLSNVDLIQARFSDRLAHLLKSNHFDFVFIDGHHSGQALQSYLDLIMIHLRPGVVVVLDDIQWSESMSAAWNEIRADVDVRAAVSFLSFGLLITR